MVFQWFKGLFKQKSNGHLTDEDRMKGLEVRRLQHQVLQLEKQLEIKQHLNFLEDTIKGNSNKNNVEDMFMNVVMQKIMAPQQQQTNPVFQAQPTSNPANDAIVSQLKPYITEKYLNIINQLSDNDIIEIKNKLTNG
jgi:hypothetical protein